MKNLKYYLCYFLLAFVSFNALISVWYNRQEEYPELTLSGQQPNLIVWRLKPYLQPGELITLAAQHRLVGPDSGFRFVVFENPSSLHLPRIFSMESPLFTVSKENAWSTWTFVPENNNILVGIAWEGLQTPVYLQQKSWRNYHSFHNYAWTGSYSAEKKTADTLRVPLRANLKFTRSRPTLLSTEQTGTTFFLLSAVLLGCLLPGRKTPSCMDWIYFTAGIVFAYRTWSSLSGPYWAWGAQYTYFLTPVVKCLLLVCFLVLCTLFPFLVRKWESCDFRIHPLAFVGLAIITAGLAWNFRCNRIYHDWLYSITNYHHAPLTSAVYAAAEQLRQYSDILRKYLPQLFSMAVLVLYLYFLKPLLRNMEGTSTPSLGGLFVLYFSIYNSTFLRLRRHTQSAHAPLGDLPAEQFAHPGWKGWPLSTEHSRPDCVPGACFRSFFDFSTRFSMAP